MPMPRPGLDFDEALHPSASEGVLAKLARLVGASTTQWGFDYAWESDSPAQLVRVLESNSTDFVGRYVNDAGGKGVTSAEAAALDAANITIAAIYETTGVDFTGGYANGVIAGQNALADMRARGA